MQKLLLSLLVFCCLAFGQNNRFAVYVVNSDLPDSNDTKIFSTKLSDAFKKDGRYREIARDQNILVASVVKEMYAQHSGDIDDRLRKEPGLREATDFVCAINITRHSSGKYNISARLIDVQSAEARIGQVDRNLDSLEDLSSAATALFESIHEETEVEREKRKKENPAPKAPEYRNFNQAERFGTFILNHALGLGSYLIQENNGGAAVILVFEALGAPLFLLGSNIKMPDRSSYKCDYGDVNECSSSDLYDKDGGNGYEYDRSVAVALKYSFLGCGIGFLVLAESFNLYHSFGYDKPKPHTTSFIDHRNFHLAILPSKNGNSLKPGVFYNVKF